MMEASLILVNHFVRRLKLFPQKITPGMSWDKALSTFLSFSVCIMYALCEVTGMGKKFCVYNGGYVVIGSFCILAVDMAVQTVRTYFPAGQ